MAPQAATAAAAALYVTDRAGVQPIGHRLKARAHATSVLAAKQPQAAQVCRLMVSTPVIHVITPTAKGWKAELAWLVDTFITKWSHVNYRSGVYQGKSANQRPTSRRQPCQLVSTTISTAHIATVYS